MKKISPFKIVGSWIGALIGLVVHTFIFHDGNFLDLFKFGVHITNGVLFTVGGFLLGWGIQSLFFKKRNPKKMKKRKKKGFFKENWKGGLIGGILFLFMFFGGSKLGVNVPSLRMIDFPLQGSTIFTAISYFVNPSIFICGKCINEFEALGVLLYGFIFWIVLGLLISYLIRRD